ncbi:unnamed protein product, partial [Dovyalis caffra]
VRWISTTSPPIPQATVGSEGGHVVIIYNGWAITFSAWVGPLSMEVPTSVQMK